MVTRIIMDLSVARDGKIYHKGEVYDSRFPLDIPVAADGIQHCIPQALLDDFIEHAVAHEQTWDEWDATRRENQMKRLNNPATPEADKDMIRQMRCMDTIFDTIFGQNKTEAS